MHALIGANGQRPIYQDPTLSVCGIGIVVVVVATADRDIGGGETWAIFVDGVVFSSVRVRGDAGVEGEARVPGCGEVGAGGVGEGWRVGDGSVGEDVLGEAGGGVGSYCGAFGAVATRVRLGREEFGVDGAHDVETVAVVGGDEDQGFGEGS